MDCSMPGFSVLHYLLEFTQIHVYWVGDAIQPSHPLLPSSPPALSLSQHQGLFQWVGCLHQVPKYWSFSFSISPSNEYSGLISFGNDWFDFLAVQGTLKSSPAPQFKSISSSVLYVKSQLTNTFSLCTRICMYVCIIYMTKIWQTALKLTTSNEFWIFYSFWFYSSHFEKPYLEALFAGWLATWLAAGVLRTTKWWELRQLNDKSNLVFKMGLNRHFSKENTQMPNKHMKRCSASLIIRKMQIKTIMSTTSHPLGRLLSKTQKITNIGEDMGKLKPLLHCWWEYKMVEPLWKMAQFPQKSRALPCDLAIPFLGKYL